MKNRGIIMAAVFLLLSIILSLNFASAQLIVASCDGNGNGTGSVDCAACYQNYYQGTPPTCPAGSTWNYTANSDACRSAYCYHNLCTAADGCQASLCPSATSTGYCPSGTPDSSSYCCSGVPEYCAGCEFGSWSCVERPNYYYYASGQCINNTPQPPPPPPTVGDSQTILLLASSTNSHGALWNDTNYLVKIQYNNIFGTSYTGANPHACTVTNRVLRLSNTTNAHAEGPSQSTTGYVDVCYGNLACTIRSGSCQGLEILVASLSSTTNAHLAADNSYTNNLCCTSGITECGAGTLLCANGQCSSDKTCAGNEEFPATNNNGICEAGESCNSQDCAFQQDSCQSGLICFSGWCQPAACPTGTTRCNDGTCNSNSLCPSNGGPYVNQAPFVNITSPLNKQIYYVNIPIGFSSIVTDDGPVTIQWGISDPAFVSSSLSSFTWTYTTPGIKVITLGATDSQGLITEKEVSILVLDSAAGVSYGIYPYIERPTHRQSIVDNNLIVNYAGEESYVVKSTVSGSPCNAVIECLAGRCPFATSSAPSCATNANITLIGTSSGYTYLFYNWTFTDGTSIISVASLGRTTGSYGYSSIGSKSINLSLNYTNAGVSLENTFKRDFNLYGAPQCTAAGTIFVEIDAFGNEISRQSTLTSIACAGKDQIGGNFDDCCPSGFACSTDPANPGCVASGNVSLLVQCSGYVNQTECSNDPLKVSGNSPLYNIYGCGTTVNANSTLCSCSWDFPTNNCGFGRTVRSSVEPTTVLSECIYQSTIGECSAGYQIVDITARLISGSDSACVDGQQTVPCLRSAIQLPFFNMIQFAIAALTIAMLYFVILRKKN